jgi:2'-5' RNA ligase
LALTDAISFQPEKRAYAPHVTLARLKQPTSTEFLDYFLNDYRDLHIPSVLVEELVLYSSVFANDVPQYRQEAVFHLSESG